MARKSCRSSRTNADALVASVEQCLFGAIAAQRRLWDLQGVRNTWFCGSYFGAGFHEDALQAGLAVAEVLGGLSRPWTIEGHSDRIHLPAPVVEDRAA